ncbi:MAG: tRNA (adenosine(37)-N6)-threonylcarbamoyltransferase complex ATPase subunit type 1 TsaE [Bacteroidetes bacterium]|jgi:tRNA threonylcarbamoyladenosine biosynthesis protein TsaE|nr:tRNA (adenosine(37)-N6)-threonylcarbamoyltransferase complex ATPase subunit type 1 TsaE [Bacteroidota bacterium]
MRFVREIASLNELDSVAGEILEKASDYKIFCFHGEMGAGKTTLIKSICRKLGVNDEVQSPTFSIVNEYVDRTKNPVYHFDFYRLKNEEEAYDLGYEHYFFSGYFCLIEWPEKVKDLLNLKKADIFIELMAEKRQITVEYD